MTHEPKTCWLIEKSGDNRQVFGPYTLDQARLEKGIRYAIIKGSGLKNGQSFRRGEVQAKVQADVIWAVEGNSADEIGVG